MSFVVKDWVPEDSSAPHLNEKEIASYNGARTSESAIFEVKLLNGWLALDCKARLDATFIILGCVGKSDLDEKITELNSRSCRWH